MSLITSLWRHSVGTQPHACIMHDVSVTHVLCVVCTLLLLSLQRAVGYDCIKALNVCRLQSNRSNAMLSLDLSFKPIFAKFETTSPQYFVNTKQLIIDHLVYAHAR